MGKAAKAVTGTVGGGLKTITGGAADLLLGKKAPGVNDHYMPLDPLQQKALDKYGANMDINTDGIARSIVSNQERQIRGNAMDLERKASQLSSQRGLGNSSVGLNAILNSTRDMGDKIGAARASLPQLQHNLKLDNLDRASGGIGNILNNRTFVQGTPGGMRSGGLAAPLLSAAGSYFGGK